jgi:hypothetical protein
VCLCCANPLPLTAHRNRYRRPKHHRCGWCCRGGCYRRCLVILLPCLHRPRCHRCDQTYPCHRHLYPLLALIYGPGWCSYITPGLWLVHRLCAEQLVSRCLLPLCLCPHFA